MHSGSHCVSFLLAEILCCLREERVWRCTAHVWMYNNHCQAPNVWNLVYSMNNYSGSVLIISRKLVIKDSLVGCLVYSCEEGNISMKTRNNKDKLYQSPKKCGLSCVMHTLSHICIVVPTNFRRKPLAQPARHQKTLYEELDYKV